MDEATAALDEANQDAMMQLVLDELPEAALVSIGHRPGLAAFHTRTLTLVRAEGGARLGRLNRKPAVRQAARGGAGQLAQAGPQHRPPAAHAGAALHLAEAHQPRGGAHNALVEKDLAIGGRDIQRAERARPIGLGGRHRIRRQAEPCADAVHSAARQGREGARITHQPGRGIAQCAIAAGDEDHLRVAAFGIGPLFL